MPVGFWDRFFDSDYRQRTDINELRANSENVTSDLEILRSQCHRMQRQISDLSVLVGVLVKVLEESGQLDAKILRYRVEAELESLAAARVDAKRAQATAKVIPPATTPTECGKCGQIVPANRTTITEAGVVCDRCAV